MSEFWYWVVAGVIAWLGICWFLHYLHQPAARPTKPVEPPTYEVSRRCGNCHDSFYRARFAVPQGLPLFEYTGTTICQACGCRLQFNFQDDTTATVLPTPPAATSSQEGPRRRLLPNHPYSGGV